MNKSDKIREYFRKYPSAEVAKVAAKFQAPKPMTYKLRKQVLDEAFQPPAMVPMPEVPKRKVTVSASQIGIARAMGVPLDEYVKEGLKQGVFKYDDEREPEAEGADVDETLDARAVDYGKFIEGAEVMQMLKRVVQNALNNRDKVLAHDQAEAMDMIIHKIGRIINGNPDVVDHWLDIAGYAQLVADRLNGRIR
jgi:hypothetical protein